MNLDPAFDRHTSIVDMERRKQAIWAQEYGRAIARGESEDDAKASADMEADAFENNWWEDQ